MKMGLIRENMRNVTKLHDSTVHSGDFEKKIIWNIKLSKLSERRNTESAQA